MTPYYDRDGITIYHGDCREILPELDVRENAVIADPPYGETSLEWDRLCKGWVDTISSRQVWCFGSLRFWLSASHEFTERGWRFAQDVVWEKHNGSGFHSDRFKRVHENVVHWYQPPWDTLYRNVPTTMDARKRTVRRNKRPTHMGHIENASYESCDGGPRLMRSVLSVRSCHGHAVHPTQKPVKILSPLIEYSVPPAGLVVDPFAGSGSTLIAARDLGRKAIGIEIEERYCEVAAKRLEQKVFQWGKE